MPLVVDMDAPRNCSGCCLMGSPNCPYDGSKVKGSDYPDCPIIGEILEPYGRLIDADRLAEAFKVFATGSEIGYLRLINEAPTVLEASDATDN